MSRFDLTDFEWTVIAPLLPNNSWGVRRVDDRCVLSGILWALRASAPWRDLPERYGPYTTVYNRIDRWRTGPRRGSPDWGGSSCGSSRSGPWWAASGP
jgi:transposase